mmetsp:Transcript_40222/g.73621  ORF Transcript_40222/g.73621 Transcript_40222/m.73621 type:complete len:343 (-) Transcript_40222:16-1044(-)
MFFGLKITTAIAKIAVEVTTIIACVINVLTIHAIAAVIFLIRHQCHIIFTTTIPKVHAVPACSCIIVGRITPRINFDILPVSLDIDRWQLRQRRVVIIGSRIFAGSNITIVADIATINITVITVDRCELTGIGIVCIRAMTPTDPSLDRIIHASFMIAAFALCPMPSTNFSFLGFVGVSFLMAAFALCPMPNANSSLDRMIGASFMIAAFDLCPMPNTDSSLDRTIGASFMITGFGSFPMPPTDSSFLGMIGASFFTAGVTSCSMLDADTSLLSIFGASFMLAFECCMFFGSFLCPMPPTNSSPDRTIHASFMLAFGSCMFFGIAGRWRRQRFPLWHLLAHL